MAKMRKPTQSPTTRQPEIGPDEIDRALGDLKLENRDSDDDWDITPTKKSRKTKNKAKVAKPAATTTAVKEVDSAQQPDQQLSITPAVPRGLLPTPPSTPMSTGRAISLLICSVGNPGAQYSQTLHSAGHTVLKSLSNRLDFSPFQKSRAHGNGLVSKPVSPSDSDWTLWQSTSLMNESGKGVKATHKLWSADKPEGESRLVVVHDEMEKPLGAVSLNVRQGASAKGHNGLKSIMATIGNEPFMRIGIGIGRPESRESKDVVRHVMRNMSPQEREKIEGCVEKVIAKLKELESG